MPDLNTILAGVRYVVVGGTATSLYMPARHTDDVDILLAAADAPAAEAALRRAGARFTGPLSIGGASWVLPDGTSLDVLVSSEIWVAAVLARPNRDAAGLPIIALPYLVLLKLQAARGVDIGDLTRMLGGAEEAVLDDVRSVVRKYLPDAAEDVESLIRLGRLEFESGAEVHLAGPGPIAALPSQAAADVLVRAHTRGGRTVRQHRRRRPLS